MHFGQKARTSRDEVAPRNSTLMLHYSGHQAVNVRGAATGNFYRFTQHQPVQAVDAKDAVFLLGTQLFRLAR